MKLRNKLKISFCIMVILPVIMCSIFAYAFFKYQATTIHQLYEVDSGELLDNFYSPVVLMGRMTENIYNEMKEVAETSPWQYNSVDFVKQLDEELQCKLSSIVVRRNGLYTYVSDNLDIEKLDVVLPDYEAGENISDEGIYKGGDYQCLVKQIDFCDSYGNQYSVSIITPLKQAIPQIKKFFIQVLISGVFILILTSLLLNVWIYRSIIKPLDRLKLATQNIKYGNFDFEMPKSSNDEIGDVCRDFEEMRVILKKTAEDKLNSDKEEKELIRNISHDLKTPLTAIKGYVEGILDGIADTPEKQHKYLMTVANKVNDMDKLIDELTIYSRLDANRILYTFIKLNVSDYFDDCCEEIGTELDASGIELNYRNHIDKPVMIVADPEQLKRVINNIISNSVKYMVEGRKGKIDIDLYDEGEYVHVVMADNGKGIAGKDISRIFERFYRTDESRNSKQGGSGIGLAIVKKIVEDHKGKIWAESVEGEGTTMHLNLLKYNENNQLVLKNQQ